MRSRSLCATVTVAALAALTIAGCSAAPSPAPGPTSHQASPSISLPTTEPPASTPPMPTPTWPAAVALPAPPPDMSRDDEVGAVAAAEYFLGELYPYTLNSQDTEAWQGMSHPDCIFCASALNTVSSLKSAGDSVTVAPIRTTPQSVDTLNPLAYGVFLSIETGPDVKRTEGGSLTRTSTGRGQASVVVVHQVDTWLIRAVELTRTTQGNE